MYVRMYVRVGHAQECQFALICTHVQGTHASHALTMRRAWAGHEIETRKQARTAFLDNGGWGDSAAGPPQRMCFVESSAERI